MTDVAGLLKPAVTADAVMFAQAAALDGVYEIGDSIDFGQGRYYQDDAGTVERISGIVKLEYDCYNATDNQTGEYNFHLTNQQNGVYSGVMIRSMKLGAPWGLSIIGGKGTQKDPYRFKILVSDPDNKPISYHEWYEVGKNIDFGTSFWIRTNDQGYAKAQFSSSQKTLSSNLSASLAIMLILQV